MTQLYEPENDVSSSAGIIDVETSPLNLPWGRLIPCLRNFEAIGQPHTLQNSSSTKNGGGFDLFPRNFSPDSKSSERHQSDEARFLGLEGISPGDRFNEYIIGRSQRCDIVSLKFNTHSLSPGKPQSTLMNEPLTSNQIPTKILDWVHSLISNRHCCIYCMIEDRFNGDERENSMEVYVEDTSGNGTVINHTTLLRRGEKRLLHTGDEICLINPTTVRKHVRIVEHQHTIIQHYTYVFVNMHRQYRLGGRLAPGASPVANLQLPINQSRYPSPQLSTRFKGHVDARATNSKSPSSVKRLYKNKMHDNSNLNPIQISKVSSSLQNVVSSDTKQVNQKNISPSALPIAAHARNNATNMRNERLLDLPYQSTKPRRIDEHYDLRNLLGRGTCGEVRRAIHRKTGIERAVKIIALSANGRNYTFARMNETERTLKAEASILQSLNHPYIVKLIDLFVSSTAVYLVMDMLPGGDLFDRITEIGSYTEKESRQTMRRILSAVHYLHEDRDVVHRDLKPENILCTSKSNNIDVKLTDFGLAKNITDDGLKTFCGTPLYFAPEVLLRRNTINGEGRYGKEADMWSLGVILYILLSGTPPFNASINVKTVVNAKIEFIDKKWATISSDAKDMILLLLQIDPKERINIKDACNHKWILKDDGDTHIHPLDDPALKSTKRMRKDAFGSVLSTLSEEPKSFDGETKLKENIIKSLKAPPQSSPGPNSKSKVRRTLESAEIKPIVKDSTKRLSNICPSEAPSDNMFENDIQSQVKKMKKRKTEKSDFVKSENSLVGDTSVQPVVTKRNELILKSTESETEEISTKEASVIMSKDNKDRQTTLSNWIKKKN